ADGLRLVLSLQLVVDLVGRLAYEEESSAEQDEVPPREWLGEDLEERRREAHDPRYREEQRQPAHESTHEPQAAGPRLLFPGQPAGENRDEDDVVDSQHDLENRERQESEPCLRIGVPGEPGEDVHGGWCAREEVAVAGAARREVA